MESLELLRPSKHPIPAPLFPQDAPQTTPTNSGPQATNTNSPLPLPSPHLPFLALLPPLNLPQNTTAKTIINTCATTTPTPRLTPLPFPPLSPAAHLRQTSPIAFGSSVTTPSTRPVLTHHRIQYSSFTVHANTAADDRSPMARANRRPSGPTSARCIML